MPRRSISVFVEPAVLKWARESIGEDIREAAEKIGVDEQTLRKWEDGVTPPNLRLTQLEKLTNFYKRPLAAFLLPEPPKEPSPPEDFRTFYGEEKAPLSRKIRLTIREARWHQAIAVELAEELDKGIRSEIGKASLSDDVEELVLRERERFGFGIEEQFQWENAGEALKEWRKAVEGRGVLVFQMSMSIPETKGINVRGFSLVDERPFVIVINSKDYERPRIFSLFHEYAHLMLHKSGICDMNWGNLRDLEVFCNHFAGAFLVPESALLTHNTVKGHSKNQYVWSDEELRELSHDFKVSREVILRRLLMLGRTNREFYEDWRRTKVRRPRRQKTGGPLPEVQSVARRGVILTSFILEAYNHDIITSLDAADYLGVRVDRIPAVSAKLGELIS